jgi:transcriptional regulator with XRE-family HTH domain
MQRIRKRRLTIPPMRDSVQELGRRLKALRRQNGWRIADVSQRTGLAVSTISKVENGRMSLTYDKLLQLAKGLALDFADLFGTAPSRHAPSFTTTRRSIDRQNDAAHVEVRGYHYWYLNTDLSDKLMTPILGQATVRTLEEFGELIRHPGEEWVFVIEGAIEVCTEFYKSVVLTVGECVYIDSNMGHAYLAAADGPCRFVSVSAGDSTERTLEKLQPEKSSPPRQTEGKKKTAAASRRTRRAI